MTSTDPRRLSLDDTIGNNIKRQK